MGVLTADAIRQGIAFCGTEVAAKRLGPRVPLLTPWKSPVTKSPRLKLLAATSVLCTLLIIGCVAAGDEGLWSVTNDWLGHSPSLAPPYEVMIGRVPTSVHPTLHFLRVFYLYSLSIHHCLQEALLLPARASVASPTCM